MKHKCTLSKTNFKNQFTIAIYPDGNKWVAHNLTLDILGVSSSKKKAIEEMQQLTEAQITFAVNSGMVKAINHPAPERFWKQVAERMNTELIGELVSHTQEVANRELSKILKSSRIYELGSHQRFA